jgi:NUMOD3 motif
MKHLHHIIPKHMGGTDEPSNLVELTILEHADAHRILYEKYGMWQDKLAWEGLAGLKNNGEIQLEAIKLSNLGRKHSPEERAKMSSNRAGKVGWLKKGMKNPYAKGQKKGFKHSEETKAKMRATHLAIGTLPPNRRGVV